MNTKRKSFIKTAVIALALLLTVALALGLSGAWYNASRRASGTITMTGGIIIDYSGFGQAEDGTWGKEEDDAISFLLFSEQENALPGASITLNNAGIKANDASVDFYARVKLTYKFYTDANGGQANDVTSQISSYSDFISTPSFASAWVDSNNNDGWYYYATGTTLNSVPKTATLGSGNYVDIFASSQSIVLNGEAEGFNHEGGGYQYNQDILIKRIEVYLTLETLQANQAAATANGWGIHVQEVVENSNSQVIEILANQITLGDTNGAYKLGTGEAGSLDYDTTTLGNTLKIIVAGDSQINANAFENSTLENVYIGDADYINGVSGYSARIYSTPATFIIGSNAFSGCSSLDIYLSSSVNYTIYASSLSGVRNIYFDGVLNNGIKSPSIGLISGTTITVLDITPSIVTGETGAGSVNTSSNSSYGAYTYEDENELKWYFNLIDNDSQAEITKCLTLGGEKPTGSITIPDLVSSSELTGSISLTKIGLAVFRDCTGLSSITIKNSVTIIGTQAFYGCTGVTSVTIPSSVTVISNHAFFGCTGLTSVTIPSLVTEIQTNAFTNCTGLTSINIPSSVTRIGSAVFSGCTSLTSIDIPSSVTRIENYAFKGCTSLTSITIPSSVTSIGSDVFSGCNSLASFIGGNSVYRVSADGRCIYAFSNISQKLNLKCFAPSGLTSYSIPSSVDGISVEAISSNAFSDLTGLTSITIPDSVTQISNYAFSGCTGLTSITIPDSVTHIGYYAFSGCTGLTSITISDSVTSIENETFSGCTSLTSITIPSSVKNIKKRSFSGCTGLTSITIPNSVTSIGEEVFSDCTGLTSITLPSSLMTIEAGLFSGCTSLTSIDIPSSVKSIKSNAFSGCTGLTSITISDSVTSIGDNLFSNCTGLTSVVLEGVGIVPTSCFRNCTNLTSVTLPVKVTSIKNYAFYGCTSLVSINWSASYNLGSELNNENVTLVKEKIGLTLGNINLPGQAELTAAGVTAPTGKVFAGWTDGTTTYTTTAPIAKVRAGLTAVWSDAE